MAAARANFFAGQLQGVPLDKVVVLDESYATTAFTPLRGRCPRHERLHAYVPAGHCKRLTILAAVTTAGVLCAMTVDASTDAAVFGAFLDQVLVPRLTPGMVVVMDNLSSHRVAAVARSIERAGCRVVYLPPYSPDYSPIEPIFSKVKGHLRRSEARDLSTLETAVGEALKTITADDCLHCYADCYADCGYTLHLK